jgi:small-conductance mechanosensitive channel
MLVHALKKTKFPLMAIVALYIGSQVLVLPDTVREGWINTITVIALLIQGALWADAVILFWIGAYQKEHLEKDAGRVTTARVLSILARVALYSILALLILDNISGVKITTLIASLGIGGIAVALAVQNILSDLFASLSIALDKPFVIGDFIIVGDYLGTVEYIGLKTTRIRSLSGEMIVVSNNDLLSSRIKNYKRMYERRVVFTLDVVYDTSADQLEEIPLLIKEIIDGQEITRFDRAHFQSFGKSALTFEAVYYVKSPDYNVHTKAQQAINLALYRRFEEKGISFAYPTQTLYVQEADPKVLSAKGTRVKTAAKKTKSKAAKRRPAKKLGAKSKKR